MRVLTRILVGVVLSLFLVVPAFAIPVFDFEGGSGQGIGTVTVAGNVATGTGIALDSFIAQGTIHDGNYDLSGPIANKNDPHDGTSARLDFTFNNLTKTGTITIVGDIGTDAIPPVVVVPTETLLTGTFTSGSFTNDAFIFTLSEAGGTDIKGAGLLRFFGITDPNFNVLAFNISANSGGGGSPYTSVSTDVFNSGKVPEPISLILLGSGLAGAGLYRRLRRK